MTIPNTTYRVLVEKLGAQDASQFIGNEGEVFYDPNNPELKLSDGSTIGGVSIGGTGGGGAANTGDVTFTGNQVIGSGTSSGDGNGFSTLELVPDSNLYANDQYIIVDPTFPTHIHLRAGGTQDASNAELFLGGENTHVRVIDGTGVRLYYEETNSNTNFYTSGVHFTGATWIADPGFGGGYIQFTSTDAGLTSDIFNANSDSIEITTDELGTFAITTIGASGLGNDVYRILTQDIPSPDPQAVTNINITLVSTNQNNVTLENGDLTIQVRDDLRITGGDIVSIRNNSQIDPITIIPNYDFNEQRWAFNPDGTLTFPDNSIQITGITSEKTTDWDTAYGWGDHSTAGYISSLTVNENASFSGIVTANSYDGSGSNLTGVTTSFTGSWTVAEGSGTYSFTVPQNASYVMWVRGNIPNGIIVWNATVTITNNNVAVIGNQYGWYYPDGGNLLVLDSIPSQIIGTAGSISSTSPAVSNGDIFSFGITNNSGSSQTVFYGYSTI